MISSLPVQGKITRDAAVASSAGHWAEVLTDILAWHWATTGGLQ